LAPLEFVIALPILLGIMALMINYGTVASWKVRGLTVARHAVWGSRWPRTGNTNPRPAYWPANATVNYADAGNVPELDDFRVNQPVARGPLPYGTTVNAQLLDPTRGLREGSAEMTRGFPMLGTKLGRYSVRAKTYLLDDQWQYQRMGLSSTMQRRIPVIYALAKAPQSLSNAYVQAYMAIFNAPFRADLAPLDNDDEYISYGRMFGWGGAPDFHPQLGNSRNFNKEEADRLVTDLINRIQGRPKGNDEQGRPVSKIPDLAETMAGAFNGLYQRVIRELERRSAPGKPPPAWQQIIDQLQQKMDTLQEFIKSSG
jgi:hypothetical protein